MSAELNWWDTPTDWSPLEDPWCEPKAWTETPNGWQYTGLPEGPEPKPTRSPDCGRCGGFTDDGGIMFHLRWECTAQEAWIEAAINDRQARPDRYRQAKRDLGATTLTQARQLLADMKATK